MHIWFGWDTDPLDAGSKRTGPSLDELVAERRRKLAEGGWDGDALNGYARSLSSNRYQEARPGRDGWTLTETEGRVELRYSTFDDLSDVLETADKWREEAGTTGEADDLPLSPPSPLS